MNEQSYQASVVFNRAKAYAYWSYIGLVIPIAGIILGILSKSTLNELRPSTADEEADMRRVSNHATVGLVISVVLIVLSAIAIVMALISYNNSQSQLKVYQGGMYDYQTQD